MSRGLSSATKAELYAGTTGEEPVVLLTITHADFGSTLRYVNYLSDVTSGGDVYTALAFSARLPADRDGPPSAMLVLDDVDRTVVADIRSITSPAQVTIELVFVSAPSTILATWSYLRIVKAQITASSVELELVADAVLDESFPGQDFTPLAFPAGFDR